MKRSLFDYVLPEELIAQTPAAVRDASRLLQVERRTGALADAQFAQLPEILRARFRLGENGRRLLMVLNDSRVYPARVRVQRSTGARGEVFLLEKASAGPLRCLLRPLKKLSVGEILYADETAEARRALTLNLEPTAPVASAARPIPLFKVESLDPPRVSVCPDDGLGPEAAARSLDDLLARYGEMPLPPYIKSDPAAVARDAALDKARYQTVYARAEGSAAAPTAGLHFTPEIFSRCKENGIDFSPVTLHVGLGTFQPVQTEDIEDHPMHEEICMVPADTCAALCAHLERGWPIAFVGTTSLRTVESFFRASLNGHLRFDPGLRARVAGVACTGGGALEAMLSPRAGAWFSTDLFVRPERLEDALDTACGDALLTNFHQPESTLTMLVAALLGYEAWRASYAHAVKARYRFFSYGDANLLLF